MLFILRKLVVLVLVWFFVFIYLVFFWFFCLLWLRVIVFNDFWIMLNKIYFIFGFCVFECNI